MYICIGIGYCLIWFVIGVFRGVGGGVGLMGRSCLGVITSEGIAMVIVGEVVIIVGVFNILLLVNFIGILIRIIFFLLYGVFLLLMIFLSIL